MRGSRGVAEHAPAGEAMDGPKAVDANVIVSYNLRAIRIRRGWTQQGLAERLGRITGHQLTQATMSAIERQGSDTGRLRRFDVHDLYVLSEVFEVPIAYFFIPPPETNEVLRDTGRPLWALYIALLGRADHLELLEERLAQVDPEGAAWTERMLEDLFGPKFGPPGWLEHYHRWRDRCADQLAARSDDYLTETAALISKVAEVVRLVREEAGQRFDQAFDGGGAEASLADQAASGVEGGVQRERP